MNNFGDPSPEPQACAYLFVYGTLLPEYAPEEFASVMGSLRTAGKGAVRGTLYNLGRYPGAVLDAASSRRIYGTVFALPDGEGLLQRLDEYEEFDPDKPATSHFIRRQGRVELTDGRTLECWIYEYNRSLEGARIVESGRYTR
jgi:gamma-glutamylcyclotransferase (GGCT)/AIG2-like uncharacterized protein YtfP